jgi:4-aminobutyrate aminotransferase-like enzyme
MRKTLSNKEISNLVKNTQVTDLTFAAGFHKADGVHFEDIEGNRYLDFSSGYGVANILIKATMRLPGWQHKSRQNSERN